MSIKALVVDDSAFMRKVISDILSEDKDIDIISTARNGEEAIKKIPLLKPDVITLDVEMPIMDGIETLEKIMEYYKIPVVMLSSLTVEGAEATLKALELGAIDFITKPASIFSMDSDLVKKELVQKVKTASTVKIIENTNYESKPVIEDSIHKKVENNLPNLIAIGTSTGGPKALQSIIPLLPKNINGSIIVVQHMPPGFTKSLANRLNTLSNVIVKEAENNEEVKVGFCYIAPGGYHLEVKQRGRKLYIKLNQNEPVSGHRPSVDIMFESVSKITMMNLMGIILTGMGSDGAKGIKKIKENNGYTIAQDEVTSVVFGMPKSAVKERAIHKVLPIDKIANEIISKVGC